jgi:hypothetical protein
LDVLLGLLISFKSSHGEGLFVEKRDDPRLVEHQLDNALTLLLVKLDFLVFLTACAGRVASYDMGDTDT